MVSRTTSVGNSPATVGNNTGSAFQSVGSGYFESNGGIPHSTAGGGGGEGFHEGAFGSVLRGLPAGEAHDSMMETGEGQSPQVCCSAVCWTFTPTLYCLLNLLSSDLDLVMGSMPRRTMTMLTHARRVRWVTALSILLDHLTD